MEHPETHIVTVRTGHAPPHKAECVSRNRTVLIRMTVEYVVDVPSHWDANHIEFHRNDGSWCASSAVDELKEITESEHGSGCICGATKFQFVREATREDGQRSPTMLSAEQIGEGNTCPSCGSTDILVGAFPLSCNACGWHYLNRYPCDVCGKPSRSTMGGGSFEKSVTMNRCKDHPFNDNDRDKVCSRAHGQDGE